MKRVISILLCLVLVLTIISSTAFAETPSEVKYSGGKGDGLDVLYEECELAPKQEKIFSFEAPFDAVVSTNGYINSYYSYVNLNITELSHSATIGQTEETFTMYYSVADEFAEKGKEYTVKLYNDFNNTIKCTFWVTLYPLNDIHATGIVMPYGGAKLPVGTKIDCPCAIEPEYSTDKIVYKSSNTKVATINDKGMLSTKKMGKTKLTAQVKGSSLQDSCTITVNEMDFNMWTSEKVNLQNYVKNVSGYKSGKWSSSNKSVVKVSSTGKLTPIKSGKATIKVKIKNETYRFNVYCYSKNTLKKKASDALKILTFFPDELLIDKTYYRVANDRSAVMVGFDFTVREGYKYTNDSFSYVAENKEYSYGFV